MQLRFEIPEGFWSLFRSVNRETYIEALMAINEEYQYSNYFLTREVCIQVLRDLYMKKQIELKREEDETEFDMLETPSARILNWLIRKGWLKKIEDYNTLVTNIVIPDYAAIFVDAFERLSTEDLEETEIYIQNVYATLFSFKNDPRVNLNMLRTALINTRRLNKALQDMLHNMDKFFERLLNKQSYDELLKEHLEGYVEEVVRRKYHILKTSDNFYIYKMDIKRWLKEMREDDAWVERIRQKQQMEQKATEDRASVLDSKRTEEELPFLYTRRNRQEDVLDLIDQIERGFDDIEHRISNMDKEHSKYIRATVSRLNYLLSDETERHGMLILLLNKLGSAETESEQSEMLKEVAGHMNLSSFDVLSDNPLYKRRRRRKFEDDLQEEEEPMELSREDVLRLNKIEHRYTAKQIEEFIDEQMADGVLETDRMDISDDESFEKLILAYDISMRKNSRYRVQVEEEQVSNGNYCYPKMTFRVKQKSIESEQN